MIKINTSIQKEIDNILKSNRPKVQWTSDKVDVLKKYKGLTTSRGLVKIFQKLFPDEVWTTSSIQKAAEMHLEPKSNK